MALPTPQLDACFAEIDAAVSHGRSYRLAFGADAWWVARAYARARGEVRGPLLALRLAFCPRETDWRRVIPLAVGGWCFVDGEPPAPLAALCVSLGVPLLVQAPGGLDAATRAALTSQEHLHGVACDPGLAPVRAALLAHVRSQGVVHLSGPDDVGKKRLVRWAHGQAGKVPLQVLGQGAPRPEPGRWTLVPNLEDLSDRAQQDLHRLLDERRPVTTYHSVVVPAGQRPDHPALQAIRGQSEPLCAVLREAVRIADSDLAVLILGEPGTGKELLARAIHDLSKRPGPFVAVDVGALADSMAEAELFGHRRGAFTGAERDREGLIRRAHQGTLFLDEFGNLKPTLQVKLLRALQEKRVLPVGDERDYPVDVRLVCATNEDLDGKVLRGEFRQDLLARVDQVRLRLPPLRERGHDIEELARTLARSLEAHLSPASLRILRAHPWPNNVRELYSVVRYAATVSGGLIDPSHLGPLAPGQDRLQPLLVTSGQVDRLQHRAGGLTRQALSALTAITLRVPALRDRPRASLRSWILGLLEGRPITLEAMDLLERQPWWGNLRELEAELKALVNGSTSLITLEELRRLLPHREAAAYGAPFVTILQPAANDQGLLEGFRKVFDGPSLLIGRVRHLAELETQAHEPRVRAWLAQVNELRGGLSPAALDLSLIPRVSRATAFVTRGQQGMLLHALPAVGLPVYCGALDAGELIEARPGFPVPLGDAGEIRLGSPDDPVTTLFVFLGEVLADQMGRVAANRVRRLPPAPTLVGLSGTPGVADLRRFTPGLARASSHPPSIEPGGLLGAPTQTRVWSLNEVEIDALTQLIVSFPGGNLRGHIADRLPAWNERPELARLQRWMSQVPRSSQYLGRLYQHPGNFELRRRLEEAIDASPDPEALRARLPTGLR